MSAAGTGAANKNGVVASNDAMTRLIETVMAFVLLFASKSSLSWPG
jgi:hypothetical protein